MRGPFEQLFDFLKRKPLLLPVVVVLMLVASLIGALQIEFEEDIFALLPQDEPLVAESKIAMDRFKGLERVVIALESDDSETLAEAIDHADAKLREIDGVKDLISRIDQSAQDDIGELYLGNAPLLFDVPMRDAIEARLTTDYFETQLQRYVDAQAGKEGLQVVDTFRPDPFGFDEITLRRFEKLRAGFRGKSDARGHILSPDGRFAVMLLEADFPANNTQRGRGFMAEIQGVLGELPDTVTAHVVGAHRSSVDNAEVIESDMHITIATSVIGILLLFIIAFRAFTPIVVTLLSVGFGFAVAMGSQGWIYGELSAITAGFAAVLLGISVDYAVHLVTTYGSLDGEREDRARRALRHVARPGFIAMVTTALAIFMLRFSNFDGLHQLAEMAIAGIAGSLAFAFVAGAQILRKVGPKPRVASVVTNAMGAMQALRRKARWAILALMLILTLALGALLPQVSFDGDVTNLDGKSDEIANSEALIQKTFGQETLSRTLVVAGGGDLETALRANDLVARDLYAMESPYESAAWVLPATKTQQENIAHWRRYWNDARIVRLKQTMSAAMATHPNTRREISFSVDRIEGAFSVFFGKLRLDAPPATLDPSMVQKRPVWMLIQNFVSEQDGRVNIGTTAQLEPSMIGRFKAGEPGVVVLNKMELVGRMVSFIQRDLVVMGGLSLLLVVTVLTLTFRNLRDVLTALLPVVGGMTWTLGLMALFGIPFNIINTLVTVFVAGLGIDYGIFFVQTWRGSRDREQAVERIKHAGAGVLIAALTTLFGFGSLALAKHPALFSVGVTTGIGVASALSLTLLVVPTLLEFRSDKADAKPE